MPWTAKAPTAADLERRKVYDSPEYRRTRAALGRMVAAGNASCWRCSRYLPPGSKWHTGHDDYDRAVIRGAECAACNLSKAASKGARIANARRKAATQSVTANRM